MKLVRNRTVNFVREERGFTLPEVMITIAILGILMGIAVPTWQSVVEGRRVDSATNQFASDLRLAHSRATNRLEDWKVVYGGANPNQYKLVSGGGTTINRTLPEGSKILSTEVLDIGGNRALSFDTRGQANPEGGFTSAIDTDGDGKIDAMVSSEDGGTKNTIHIAPATAEVEVVS